MTGSWPPDVFDRIHARESDPWQVETSEYERAKYAAALAALPSPYLQRGLEVGCSIGAQTILLAESCAHLLALDIAAEPVRRTRERCAHLPHVDVRQARIPADWPAGEFDLIVLSEVLYFLDRPDLDETARLAARALSPGGAILLVDWTGPTDTPNTGDEAAMLFLDVSGLSCVRSQREASYQLDLLKKADVITKTP